jgi:hypothetical protein
MQRKSPASLDTVSHGLPSWAGIGKKPRPPGHSLRNARIRFKPWFWIFADLPGREILPAGRLALFLGSVRWDEENIDAAAPARSISALTNCSLTA